MELVPYVRILRRRWSVVVALTCLGVLLAVSSWYLQRDASTFYRATHTLVATGGKVNLDQAAAVAVAGDVPERVAARLPGSSAGALAAQVKATARPDVGFVEITAVGTDPARTAAVADAFAEELAVYMARLDEAGTTTRMDALQRRVDELDAEVTGLEQQLAATVDPVVRSDLTARIAARTTEQSTLTAELDSLRQAALTTTVLQTFSTAEAVPISGPQFRELFRSGDRADGADPAVAIAGSQPLGLLPRLVLGGGFGLLAGIAAALIIERLDPRLRTKAVAEEVYGWPVITEVPPLSRGQQHDKAVLSTSAPRSRTAEAYRVLRSSVLLAGSGVVPVEDDLQRPERGPDEGLVVLVTSASPTEGKTTTVANLAAVLGESGSQVLVVNCDFRRPTLGAYLGVDTHLAKVVATDVPNVRLLAQVTDDPEHANPADVIAMQRRVIEEARKRFDIVVLDTAPLLTTNDANDVLDTADLILVVARAGRTTREAADRCAEVLERRRAPVLGVVLVAAADAPSGRYYYYGDYYLDDQAEGRRRNAPSPEHTEAVLVGQGASAASHSQARTSSPASPAAAAATPTSGPGSGSAGSVASPEPTPPVSGGTAHPADDARHVEDGATSGASAGSPHDSVPDRTASPGASVEPTEGGHPVSATFEPHDGAPAGSSGLDPHDDLADDPSAVRGTADSPDGEPRLDPADSPDGRSGLETADSPEDRGGLETADSPEDRGSLDPGGVDDTDSPADDPASADATHRSDRDRTAPIGTGRADAAPSGPTPRYRSGSGRRRR